MYSEPKINITISTGMLRTQCLYVNTSTLFTLFAAFLYCCIREDCWKTGNPFYPTDLQSILTAFSSWPKSSTRAPSISCFLGCCSYRFITFVRATPLITCWGTSYDINLIFSCLLRFGPLVRTSPVPPFAELIKSSLALLNVLFSSGIWESRQKLKDDAFQLCHSVFCILHQLPHPISASAISARPGQPFTEVFLFVFAIFLLACSRCLQSI